MRANIFLTIISLILAGLIGYWVFSNAKGQEQDTLCGICSSVCFLATLIPAIGIRYESERIGTNIRVLSGMFFVAFLVSHFYFANYGIKMPLYVILNGILLLIYLGVFYKINSAQENEV
jgi:hypothetical protein